MKRKAWQGGLSLVELIVALTLLSGVLLMTVTVRFNFQGLVNMGMNQAILFLNTHLALDRIVSAIQHANYLEIDAGNNTLTLSRKVGEEYISSRYYRDPGGNLCYQPDLSASPLPSPEIVLPSVTGFQLTGFPEGGERFQMARVRLEAEDPQGIARRDALFQTAAFCRIFHGSYKPVRVVTRDSSGNVTTVKGSYDTIQEAIDAKTTVDGDVVQVSSNGKKPYVENLNNAKAEIYAVKGIVLEGGFDAIKWERHYKDPANPGRIDDAYETIIDGGSVGAVISFSNLNSVTRDTRVGSKIRIDGFTIRNGYVSGRWSPSPCRGASRAGGIFIHHTENIAISNNLITSNEGLAAPGGVAINGASKIEISGNSITGNKGNYAGGVYVEGGQEIVISNNLISENIERGCVFDWIYWDPGGSWINQGQGFGCATGVCVEGVSVGKIIISNNTIKKNTATDAPNWYSPLIASIHAETQYGSIPFVGIFNNLVEDNQGKKGIDCLDIGDGTSVNPSEETGIATEIVAKNNILKNNIVAEQLTTRGLKTTVFNNLISGGTGWALREKSFSPTGPEYVYVENNTIEDNAEGGISIPGYYRRESSAQSVIRRNIVRNNSYGIFVGDHSSYVVNNLVDSNQGYGIHADPCCDTKSVSIANNVVVGNGTGVQSGNCGSAGTGACAGVPPPGVTSFYYNAHPDEYKKSKVSVKNSILINNSNPISLMGENHSSSYISTSDPKFVNSGKGDFTLAAGSPAIDAGDPDQKYYDIYDKLTYPTPDPATTPALPPAKGTIRNDIGAYGGPHAGVIGFVMPTEDDPSTPLIREDVIGTY